MANFEVFNLISPIMFYVIWHCAAVTAQQSLQSATSNFDKQSTIVLNDDASVAN